jgi:predicted Fe-Mo cluster-binding NifX family protein
MDIGFALAVNKDHQFEAGYFGDAEMFLIYRLSDEKLSLSQKLSNSFRGTGGEPGQASEQKGEAIAALLRENHVNILVAREFGRNISVINGYFVPVIVSKEELEEVIGILNTHMHWIQDELEHARGKYRLFTIRGGILKTPVQETDSETV